MEVDSCKWLIDNSGFHYLMITDEKVWSQSIPCFLSESYCHNSSLININYDEHMDISKALYLVFI